MTIQISSIKIERGLHVLHYVRADAGESAPSVAVRVTDRSRGEMEIVSAPDAEAGVLDAPGSCLVIRSERSGVLDVSVRARRPGRDEVELRLDTLSSGRDRRDEAATPAQAATLEVIGHVSRRGDVHAAAGEWVAGPDAPGPIEGIVVRLASAHRDLGLTYQALIGGREPRWTDWVMPGGFSGSRGQHQPLLGLRVRLTGQAAAAWELRSEALFLGAPIRASGGAEIEFMSDSGLDPLIGFKIALIPMRAAADRAEAVRTDRSDSGREGGSGRVRVFRASGTR